MRADVQLHLRLTMENLRRLSLTSSDLDACDEEGSWLCVQITWLDKARKWR